VRALGRGLLAEIRMNVERVAKSAEDKSVLSG
jgi:hypothetical protein